MNDDNKHIKSGFYHEYAKAKAEKQREKYYREQYRVPAEKPLVIDTTKSVSVKVLNCLTDTLKKAGKFLLYLLFFFLASLGLTALLNPPTREYLAGILNNLFH